MENNVSDDGSDASDNEREMLEMEYHFDQIDMNDIENNDEIILEEVADNPVSSSYAL